MQIETRFITAGQGSGMVEIETDATGRWWHVLRPCPVEGGGFILSARRTLSGEPALHLPAGMITGRHPWRLYVPWSGDDPEHLPPRVVRSLGD